MPTYTLLGVEVDFPYEAYDCQVREERTAREERREREAGRGPIRARILSPLTPTITPTDYSVVAISLNTFDVVRFIG